MILLREIPSIETNNILQIIFTLSDNTRLEILSLLMKNKEGLTAAEISRLIDKKIPSTIYQLEKIQTSGLITNKMKRVKSIGREIKHWILHPENYKLSLNLDLMGIINENQLSIIIRNAYIDNLIDIKLKEEGKINVNDLIEFDIDILSNLTLLDGSKLKDKEKTRILQIKPIRPLLLDALIYKMRLILNNFNINEGYHKDTFGKMLTISNEVVELIIEILHNYTDVGYDIESQFLFRKE